MKLSAELKIFVEKHEGTDAHSLALQMRKFPDIDMNLAIRQIVGRKIAKEKIPTWHVNADIIYPAHLSLEQCSSEAAALYKSTLCTGDTMADLTGGMGVDISFLATNFKQAVYVEQQRELSEIAEHNFKALGLKNITVENADGVKYLAEMQAVDFIYIDPARRDNVGKKTVSIEDCTPNILEIEDLLEQKAKTVMIKLSPMLDISLALRRLRGVSDVHIVAVNNEVKELLFIKTKGCHCGLDPQSPNNQFVFHGGFRVKHGMTYFLDHPTKIHCINIQKNNIEKFTFNREEESDISVNYTAELGKYFYEPNAAIMKGGAYKSIANAYALQKLHPNSHLYTSDEFHADFQGRKFVVKDVCSLKQVMAGLKPAITKANITVRNFPLSVAEIRKKTGLKEGGDSYIFATTLADEHKVLIIAEKN